MLKFDRVIGFLLVVVLLSGGCAGKGMSSADKEVRLKLRCDGYIAARIKGSQVALQKYYLNPEEAKVGQVLYRSSEIVDMKIAEDGVNATVHLKSKVMAMGFVFEGLKQPLHWEWHENEWYIVPVKAAPNPFVK